ncbi:hypothetical protein HUN08_02195 [Gordonia sp. X0973]|uniref:hypothetical protein n=1 Tax=Gordonia sp. X0973 TaxID=2742602 RepID=UPI000FA05EEA|nr:hypothetical protein [Gordonia sp. X0973]QKT06130.1 hypothetical protein HUN08_02195 [Gordonia sp. X0973]
MRRHRRRLNPVDEVTGDPFDASEAPRLKPMTYPGVWPDHSVVIAADRIWELNDRDGFPLEWEDTPPVRLGVCRVRDERSPDRPDGEAMQLGRLAEDRRFAMIDRRVPVVAIGSNAAPSQLRYKFANRPEALFIPQVRARISGVGIGYMSQVSIFGYIAATAYPDADSEVTLAVQLLDEKQLTELDASESPHYRRVWLGRDQGVEVLLATGERLPGVYAYVAAGGVLTDAAGDPIPMRIPGEPRPGALSQSELMDALQSDPQINDAVGELTDAELSAAISGAGRIRADNPFYELDDCMGRCTPRYGDLPRIGPVEEAGTAGPGDTLLWVKSSPDGMSRGGKSVVRFANEDWERLGKPTLVSIRSAALYASHGDATPSALAAVHPFDPKDPPPPEPGGVQVDHVLRMACGLERGDALAVRPAHVERARGMDWLLGKPTYLTMRVTLADPATTERDVVLMPRLAIDVLGIESGDYVVLEGTPDASGEAPTVVLKVFEVPSDVEEARRNTTGGSWGARFPAARETFGANPEIPMAFIDAELRYRLGVSGQTLATVRARPGRLHRFYIELREILLVLAVALLGVVTVINDAPIQIALIVGLVLLSMVLVFGRMRRRLSHRANTRNLGKARRR